MKGWVTTRTASDRSKRYDASWRVGRTIKSKTFTKRRDADTFLTEQVRKVQTGVYREIQKPVTFQAYAESWLQGLTNLKPSTRGAYTITLHRHLLPALGPLPLGQIGPEEVNRYLASQEGTLRPKTLQNQLSLLSKLLSDAVETGRLAANRLLRSRAVRRPKAVREDDEIRIEVPTHAEVNRILDALPPRWQPFFLTLALTGLRYGEAMALTWADFEDGLGRLQIRRTYYRHAFYVPKTKRSRRAVELGEQLVAVLCGVRRERFGDRPAHGRDLIFPSRLGRPYGPTMVRLVWLAALAQAQVRHLRTHSLRHFYASAQIALGTNIKYVSTQLGHASVQITVDRYGHLFPDERRVAARRLEELLSFPIPSSIHPAEQDGNAVSGGSR